MAVSEHYAMSKGEEDVLLLAADIVARQYHAERRARNPKYKAKDWGGSQAHQLRVLVRLSRAVRDQQHAAAMAGGNG